MGNLLGDFVIMDNLIGEFVITWVISLVSLFSLINHG